MGFLDNLKVGPKILIGYVIILLAMVGIAAMSIVNLMDLSSSFNDIVEYNDNVTSKIQELKQLTLMMQSGHMSYLITGENAYLNTYSTSSVSFDQTLSELVDVIQDDPEQVTELQEIKKLKQTWVSDAAVPEIALRSMANQNSYSTSYFEEVIGEGTGEKMMTEFRATLASIEDSFEIRGDTASQLLAVQVGRAMYYQESGMRGFLITGDENFLIPYKLGREEITDYLDDLRTTVRGDEINWDRFNSVSLLSAKWLSQAAEPAIEARYQVNENSTTIVDVANLMIENDGMTIITEMENRLDALIKEINELNAVKAQEVEKTKDNILRTNLIVGTLAIIIGLGAGIIIARRITTPLKLAAKTAEQIASVDLENLTHEMDRFASGDLTRSLTTTAQKLKIDQKDEIGQIAKSFNLIVEKLQQTGEEFGKMAAKLRDTISDVANSANEVDGSASMLSMTASNTENATRQISMTFQEIARGTQQQTMTINQTVNSVEQVTMAIDGVAKGAQEQAQAVNKASEVTSLINRISQQVALNTESVKMRAVEASEAAKSGSETVEKSLVGMQNIQDKVRLSAEKVREMGDRSKQINAIIETIDDIASQTNLLALNAAIEAARAGEHGKGFAVVADEVGKLAERSSTATKEITTIIKDIQKTVLEAVTAMNEGTKEVESGVVLAKESGEALEDILAAYDGVVEQSNETATAVNQMKTATDELVAAVESVSAIVEENTAASEEMSASSSEVTVSIENIAAISEENSAAVEEVSASAEEINAQVGELNDAAQSLNKMASALQNIVKQFIFERTEEDLAEEDTEETENETKEVVSDQKIPAQAEEKSPEEAGKAIEKEQDLAKIKSEINSKKSSANTDAQEEKLEPVSTKADKGSNGNNGHEKKGEVQ